MNIVNIFKTINSETIKEEFENTYIDYLQDKFEDSPNYRVVYKNLDTSTSYKALIVEYDIAKNLIGYKKFVSYPYSTQMFDIGDYITFLYNGVNTNWLIFAVDKQFDYNVTGKIKKCNNNLKYFI